VALLVALLVVSCTPDQPDQIATGVAGKDPVEPQLRAQKPVEKISKHFEYKCASFVRGCPFVWPSRSGRRKTETLVTQLQQDKPSWLRYIKAVEVYSMDEKPHRAFIPELLVQTGIFVDQEGKDMGAVICRAMLEEKVDSAAIYGAGRSLSAVWQPELARCQ
jgi:hypothetical protein